MNDHQRMQQNVGNIHASIDRVWPPQLGLSVGGVISCGVNPVMKTQSTMLYMVRLPSLMVTRLLSLCCHDNSPCTVLSPSA